MLLGRLKAYQDQLERIHGLAQRAVGHAHKKEALMLIASAAEQALQL